MSLSNTLDISIRTEALIIILFFLLPLSVKGLEAIKASVLYNKANTTLTVKIKNYSEKVITIQNLSLCNSAGSNLIELAFKRTDGKVRYYSVPLANEPANYIWKDFSEIQQDEMRKCLINGSIRTFKQIGELVSLKLIIAFFYRDSTGKYVYEHYQKEQGFYIL